MERRTLQKSGIEVSALGMGCCRASPSERGRADDSESVRTVRVALDMEITFFDMAVSYGWNSRTERSV